MLDWARGLRRRFGAAAARPRDGLTGGDATLLDLLDLDLLLREAKSADIAAGRIGARDPDQRRLEAARVWREVARRNGDPQALRKAAAAAELAASGFDRRRRPEAWARARCEQAACALLGADLTGDSGLDAAAAVAFSDARLAGRGGLGPVLADLGLAGVHGRRDLTRGAADRARAAYAEMSAPIAALDALTRRLPAVRMIAADARLARADLMGDWGERLGDAGLLGLALIDAEAALARLDEAYEPLGFARAGLVRGQALARIGQLEGDLTMLSEACGVLAGAVEAIRCEQSPLDWARAQAALGQALQALGETADDGHACERAASCFDRALTVLKPAAGAPLRARAAAGRARALASQADLTGDLAILDAAEVAMKIELAALRPGLDPSGWALAQLHLARLYEARIAITARDDGDRRAKALIALEAAREVFVELGQTAGEAGCAEALERLRVSSAISM